MALATGAPGGSFVVVGLVIRSENRLARWVAESLFGIQAGAMLDRFETLAAEAGLRTRVVDPAETGLRVPVVVADWPPG